MLNCCCGVNTNRLTPMTNKHQNLWRPRCPFFLGDHLLVQFLGDILPPSVTFPIHNHCPMAPCSGTNEPDWQLVVLLISAVVTVCYFPLAFFTSHTLGCHAPPPCVTLIKYFLPFHIIYPSICHFQIVAVYLPLCPVCLSFLLCLYMC